MYPSRNDRNSYFGSQQPTETASSVADVFARLLSDVEPRRVVLDRSGNPFGFEKDVEEYPGDDNCLLPQHDDREQQQQHETENGGFFLEEDTALWQASLDSASCSSGINEMGNSYSRALNTQSSGGSLFPFIAGSSQLARQCRAASPRLDCSATGPDRNETGNLNSLLLTAMPSIPSASGFMVRNSEMEDHPYQGPGGTSNTSASMGPPPPVQQTVLSPDDSLSLWNPQNETMTTTTQHGQSHGYPKPFLTEVDVVFGRGKHQRNHVGNQRMRNLVESHREEYESSFGGRNGKTNVAKKIVRIVQSEGGRFLKPTPDGWCEVTDDVASSKVAHAFRDGRKKGR